MPRRIKITGQRARYIERRAVNIQDDEREIIMEGEEAQYEEYAGVTAPHFPLNGQETEGTQLYEQLVRHHFISSNTELDCWLYVMGYTTQQPAEVKPIQWLKNVQLAQELLRGIFAGQLDNHELTMNRLMELTEQCFVKDDKPLKLAKNKPVPSTDSDLIQTILRPNAT